MLLRHIACLRACYAFRILNSHNSASIVSFDSILCAIPYSRLVWLVRVRLARDRSAYSKSVQYSCWWSGIFKMLDNMLAIILKLRNSLHYYHITPHIHIRKIQWEPLHDEKLCFIRVADWYSSNDFDLNSSWKPDDKPKDMINLFEKS